MSLERYVENAWLRREATSAQEITDQLGIVARSMKDATDSTIRSARLTATSGFIGTATTYGGPTLETPLCGPTQG